MCCANYGSNFHLKIHSMNTIIIFQKLGIEGDIILLTFQPLIITKKFKS